MRSARVWGKRSRTAAEKIGPSTSIRNTRTMIVMVATTPETTATPAWKSGPSDRLSDLRIAGRLSWTHPWTPRSQDVTDAATAVLGVADELGQLTTEIGGRSRDRLDEQEHDPGDDSGADDEHDEGGERAPDVQSVLDPVHEGREHHREEQRDCEEPEQQGELADERPQHEERADDEGTDQPEGQVLAPRDPFA